VPNRWWSASQSPRYRRQQSRLRRLQRRFWLSEALGG